MSITINLHLSGGLRAILPDRPECITVTCDRPELAGQILIEAGINPRVIMKLIVNGRVADKSDIIDQDAEIYLIAPMAGG